MSTFIIILIILIAIGSADDKSSKKTTSYRRKPTRKDIKRARKARERAEMDAYEDMLIYTMSWY